MKLTSENILSIYLDKFHGLSGCTLCACLESASKARDAFVPVPSRDHDTPFTNGLLRPQQRRILLTQSKYYGDITQEIILVERRVRFFINFTTKQQPWLNHPCTAVNTRSQTGHRPPSDGPAEQMPQAPPGRHPCPCDGTRHPCTHGSGWQP